jgi:hypothetical protein
MSVIIFWYIIVVQRLKAQPELLRTRCEAMQRFLFHRQAFRLLLLGLSSAVMFPRLAWAEDSLEASFQQSRTPRAEEGVYKERIVPHWLAGSAAFWYRNDLPRGKREFILVDAVKATRAPAFDHAKLAAALKEATGKDADSERLALEALEFDLAENKLLCRTSGKDWRCDLATYELAEIADRKLPAAEEEPAADERPGRRFRRRDSEDGPRSARDRSPDGKWSAVIRDHNVFIRSPRTKRKSR